MENENNDVVLKGEKVTENIWLCPDGVYRWTYEFDMRRNPMILFTVLKVMAIAWTSYICLRWLLTFLAEIFTVWGISGIHPSSL